jgi:hypothetical protein
MEATTLETTSAEQSFVDIMESRTPIFEIVSPNGSRHYKIYLDGRIEGFDEKGLRIKNLIAPVISSLMTRSQSSNA